MNLAQNSFTLYSYNISSQTLPLQMFNTYLLVVIGYYSITMMMSPVTSSALFAV
jgi:hypothetical protein